MLSKTVEGAQKKVEEQNFNIRKRVLDYDDVLNKQREVIYSERRRVLEGEDLGEQARDWIAETLVEVVDQFGDDDSLPADWDLEALFLALQGYYPMSFTLADIQADLDDEADPLTREELLDKLEDDMMDAYERRETELGDTSWCATSSAGCCSSSSTSTGASTSTTWTTCARASTCARSARRTRSRSTGSRATRCSTR